MSNPTQAENTAFVMAGIVTVALFAGIGIARCGSGPTVRPPRDLYTPAQRLEHERHCEAECYPEPVKVWQAKICVCESGDKAPGFEVAQ